MLNHKHVKKIKNGWMKRSTTIGRNVSVMTDNNPIIGKAIKIDDSGALMISKGKKIIRVLVGDIDYH